MLSFSQTSRLLLPGCVSALHLGLTTAPSTPQPWQGMGFHHHAISLREEQDWWKPVVTRPKGVSAHPASNTFLPSPGEPQAKWWERPGWKMVEGQRCAPGRSSPAPSAAQGGQQARHCPSAGLGWAGGLPYGIARPRCCLFSCASEPPPWVPAIASWRLAELRLPHQALREFSHFQRAIYK